MKNHAVLLSCLVALAPLTALADDTTQTTLKSGVTKTEQSTTTTPTTTQPTPPTIDTAGTIGTQPAPATAKDFISFTQNTEALSGRLGKKYQTVTLTLRNTNQAHVEILHGEILNAVEETAVLNEDAQHKSVKRGLAGGLLRGVAGGLPVAIPGMSYNTIRAIGWTQHVAGAAANVVSNPATTPNTPAAASGQYQRKITDVVLSPQEAYSFTVIVPKEEKAHFKLVFKDLKTNEIYNIQE